MVRWSGFQKGKFVNNSAFALGCRAYCNGIGKEDCPTGINKDEWVDGWLEAKHYGGFLGMQDMFVKRYSLIEKIVSWLWWQLNRNRIQKHIHDDLEKMRMGRSESK